MSDQAPYEPQQPQNTNPQPVYNDWRDQRHAEREQRRAERRARYGSGPWAGSGAWIGGAVLILIGVVFLLQNFGIFFLDNWWALFILIPAFGAFTAAWNEYQNAGRLTAAARGSMIGGMFLTILAAIFLFGLTWNLLWPAILILAGVVILLNAVLPG